MTWLLFIAFFAIAAVYGAMDDGHQEQWAWTVVQIQMVVLALIGYVLCPYSKPKRKTVHFIIVLYCAYIAATDSHGVFGVLPNWILTIEAIAFGIWGAYAFKRASGQLG